jgi:hypothetical protein
VFNIYMHDGHCELSVGPCPCALRPMDFAFAVSFESIFATSIGHSPFWPPLRREAILPESTPCLSTFSFMMWSHHASDMAHFRHCLYLPCRSCSLPIFIASSLCLSRGLDGAHDNKSKTTVQALSTFARRRIACPFHPIVFPGQVEQHNWLVRPRVFYICLMR